MKDTGWLSLDHHQWLAIDLIDGRRIELSKGDRLLVSVESTTLKQKDGIDIIYPNIQVAQIIKKMKDMYIEEDPK